MDVLPAVSDSWFGLDGSRYARVQLAVEVPDVGRVVQLECGRSTSGRWFLAWVG